MIRPGSILNIHLFIHGTKSMFDGYEFDLGRVVSWVKENGFRTVGIQLPDGLRTKHKRLAEAIEERTEAMTVFIAEPCFGACDLADERVKAMGVDGLIHIGHSPLGANFKVPVLFEPLYSTVPLESVVEKAKDHLEPPVGLLTTVQHLRDLGKAKALLEKKGIEVRLSPGTRAKGYGQVLGCSYSALHAIDADVNSYLFIGSGRFHPLGAALSTRKKVMAADPYTGNVEDMAELKERTLRRRHGLISKAKFAHSFIVIVSLKSGQQRMELAKRLRKMLLENVRGVSLAAMDMITPDNLLGLEGEVIVSTACPRVALDDTHRFDRPVITPPELEIALDLRKWEDYALDEF